MIKIGITGVIGSGKTTIANILKGLKIPVIDADEISRNLTRKGTPVFKKVIETFGNEILNTDGELDRKKLAEIVFSNPKKRKLLENIIHPAVKAERSKIINELKRKNINIVALDIPLLFEAGMDKEVDFIITAYADENTLFERVRKRDGMTFEEFSKRLKNQNSLEEKMSKSDFVIDTRKNVEELKIELSEIINKISSKSTKG